MSLFDYVTGSANLPFSASIPVPAIGSPVTAQSVREGMRSLADRTAVLSSSLNTISGSIASDVLALNNFVTEVSTSVRETAWWRLNETTETGPIQLNINNTYKTVTPTWSFSSGSNMVGSAVSNGVTASWAGYYRLDANFSFKHALSENIPFLFSFFKNGSKPPSTAQAAVTAWNSTSTNVTASVHINDVIWLNVGDTVAPCVRRAAGSANVALAYLFSSFTVTKL